MRKVSISIFLWGGVLAEDLSAGQHKVSRDLAYTLGQPGASVDAVVQYRNGPIYESSPLDPLCQTMRAAWKADTDHRVP